MSKHTAHTMQITYKDCVGLINNSNPQLSTEFELAKMMSYEFGIIGVHMRIALLPMIDVAA